MHINTSRVATTPTNDIIFFSFVIQHPVMTSQIAEMFIPKLLESD